jgi:hypothetical protein
MARQPAVFCNWRRPTWGEKCGVFAGIAGAAAVL